MEGEYIDGYKRTGNYFRIFESERKYKGTLPALSRYAVPKIALKGFMFVRIVPLSIDFG